MAMKGTSHCYNQAKISQDKTFIGISSESWLSCINYLGKQIIKKNDIITTKLTREKEHTDL